MSPYPDTPDGFRDALEGTLQGLQQALLYALMEAGVVKPGPTAIGRRLGLDKSMAWKVGHIAKAVSPLKALNFVPGSAGTRIILDAFRKAEISEAVCDDLEASFDKLEQDIKLHAGDRSTAKTMAQAALSGDEQSPLDENLRRDQFRTAKAIWGAQARVQVKVDFLAPGATPGSVDGVVFEGFEDLLRIRPGESWRIARKRVVELADPSNRTGYSALDPELSDSGLPPLFRDHCSHPLPKVAVSEDQNGFKSYDLEPGRVGRTGLVTCKVATMCPGMLQLSAADAKDTILAGAQLLTPSELVVQDVFIHRDLAPLQPPTAGLFSQMKAGATYPLSAMDQELPIHTSVELLPSRPGGAALLEVPGHAKAVQDAIELARTQLGRDCWNLEEFVGYRLRLAYPPIPTLFGLIIQLQLPEGLDE